MSAQGFRPGRPPNISDHSTPLQLVSIGISGRGWTGVNGGFVWLVGWCGWWDGVDVGTVWLVGWCGWWDGVVGGMVWLVGWCG